MVYDEIPDSFRRLVRIMERLQEPGGCPWDLAQTHESLRPYLIEEAYEAVDAIDRGDLDDLPDELGDVLLQVVFHSVLAARTGRFDIDRVIEAASRKMVWRHPHVFGEAEANTPREVLLNWEKLKQLERAEAAKNGKDGAKAGDSGAEPKSALSGVPANLPALIMAQRMQEKAARVGFDWENALQVLDKVEEEMAELREALAAGDEGHSREEFGDLVFSLVNLARFLDIDAESAVRGTCAKFKRRFEHVESEARRAGRKLEDMTLAEMDALWDDAKRPEKD